MSYHFKVHREGSGFWAECVELEGCVTQGEDKEELFANMQEALNLFLQEPAESNQIADLPNERAVKMAHVVEVPVDPEVAFAFMVRYHRVKNHLLESC